MTLDDHQNEACAILWRRLQHNREVMSLINEIDPDTFSLMLSWFKIERQYQDYGIKNGVING